jgi:hypothetical protein
MIASGLSDPPDDGSAIDVLKVLESCVEGRLVWDSGGAIRNQYEEKLKPETFGKDWLIRMLQKSKIVPVDRKTLPKGPRVELEETGLVGEDLKYYVRTAANSPDRKLVSHDSDYDAKTCAVLRKGLGVDLLGASQGLSFLESA